MDSSLPTWWVFLLVLHSSLTHDQNTQFNSALKQSSQLRADLDAFASSSGTSPTALQGRISSFVARTPVSHVLAQLS